MTSVLSHPESSAAGAESLFPIEDEELLSVDCDDSASRYHALHNLDCRSAPTVMQPPYDQAEFTSYGERSAATSIVHGPVHHQDEAQDLDEGEHLSDHTWANLYNAELTEGVQNQILAVENELKTVRAKRNQLEKKLFDPKTGKNGEKRKRITKVPALLFTPPYFKDASGMAPPRNVDSQRKIESGEFDPLLQPPKRWNPQDLKRLLDSIKEDIIASKKQPLFNRIDLLKEKRSKVDAETLVEIDANITALQRDIRKIDRIPEQQLYAEHGNYDIDWLKIANKDFRGARTSRECQLKWTNELCPDANTEQWADEEVDRLRQLVDGKERPNWTQVATDLGTSRTAFCVFEKYQSELNMNHLNREWTADEDEMLKKVVQEVTVGNYICWEQVSYYMEGRTKSQCMFRYQRVLRGQVKKGRWTEQEDLLLMLAVNKNGAQNWSKISSMVEGRTDAQCRERWSSCLDHKVMLGDWCKEEDELLLFLIELFGEGEWARVGRILKNRTSNSIKSRYKMLNRKGRAEKIVSTGVALDSPGQLIQWKHVELDDRTKHKMNIRAGSYGKKKEEVRKQFEGLVGLSPEKSIRTKSADELLELDKGVYEFIKSLPGQVGIEITRKVAAVQMKQKNLRRNSCEGKQTAEEHGFPLAAIDWEKIDSDSQTVVRGSLALRETLRATTDKADFNGDLVVMPHADIRKQLCSFYNHYLDLRVNNGTETLVPSIATCKLYASLLRMNDTLYQRACQLYYTATPGSVRERLALLEPLVDAAEPNYEEPHKKSKGRKRKRIGDERLKGPKYTRVVRNGQTLGVKDEAQALLLKKLARGQNLQDIVEDRPPEPEGPFIPSVLMSQEIKEKQTYKDLKNIIRSLITWPMLMTNIELPKCTRQQGK